MANRVVYWVLLITGLTIIVIGILNVYNFWGERTFASFIGVTTGFICLVGGFVNLGVAFRVRRDLPSRTAKQASGSQTSGSVRE